MKNSELERTLARILDEFEPTSPRTFEGYVGGVLQTVTVPDGMNDLLDAAEAAMGEGDAPEEEDGE